MAHVDRYACGMVKDANVVLAANLRALRDATPLGQSKGNRAVGEATKLGEGTVGRARRGDGNLTLDNLQTLAKYYKREAWELLTAEFRPDVKLRIATDQMIEQEVQLRFKALVAQFAAGEVSDEEASRGPSVRYPFGPVQNARPEPPAAKPRAETGDSAKEAGPKEKRRPRKT